METLTEKPIITRPALISFAEFKKRLNDQDSFRPKNDGNRIIYYDPDGKFPYKFQIPVIGPKQLCYMAVYYQLFISENEQERSRYIQEGAFKYPLSFNFARALDVSYPDDREEIAKFHKEVVMPLVKEKLKSISK